MIEPRTHTELTIVARLEDLLTELRSCDTSGIDAAVETLGHVAELVNAEADLLRRALTPPDVYTVIGVWQDDEPIPVGVVAGEHEVSGGDSGEFEQGVWATSVVAPDSATAEHLAIDEMRVG